MEHDEIIAFYNELAELSNAGREDEARQLMEEKFSQLPEDVQGRIAALLFAGATIEEGVRNQVLSEIREKGIEALEKLNEAEERLDGAMS